MARCLTLLLLLPLVSCIKDEPHEDLIWDFVPLSLELKVVDAQGYNLLAPRDGQTWDPTSVVAIYDGKTYPARPREEAERGIYKNALRALPVIMYGLTYRTSLPPSGAPITDPLLSFGDFKRDGDGDYTIELQWRDGTRHTIRIDHHFWFANKHTPRSITKYYIDGTEQPLTNGRYLVLRK